jgi:hypothetical protein
VAADRDACWIETWHTKQVVGDNGTCWGESWNRKQVAGTVVHAGERAGIESRSLYQWSMLGRELE